MIINTKVIIVIIKVKKIIITQCTYNSKYITMPVYIYITMKVFQRKFFEWYNNLNKNLILKVSSAFETTSC